MKRGDKVVCIRTVITKKKSYTHITKGKVYDVVSCKNNDLCLINDVGKPYIYSSRRFRLVSEYRDTVIDDILS